MGGSIDLPIFQYCLTVYKYGLDPSLERLTLIRRPTALAILIFVSYCKLFILVEYYEVCSISLSYLSTLETVKICSFLRKDRCYTCKRNFFLFRYSDKHRQTLLD